MELAPTAELYTDGSYLQQHPDWHLGDAPGKAQDLLPGLLAAIADRPDPNARFRVADVGGGVGGVLDAAVKLLQHDVPGLKIDPVVLEISPQAVEKGRSLFPAMPFVPEPLAPTHGPFDAVILADVLEHLENPREMLRNVAATATHVVLRQPLLENFSRFRHDGYRNQRETWGHISYFNCRSICDLMTEMGFAPLKISLLAPWELSGGGKGSFKSRMVVKANRVLGSHLIDGFYLTGAFRRADTH